MDTEEGVEVVWNEVIYSQSSRKANKGSKERLKAILQGLTSVKVRNIIYTIGCCIVAWCMYVYM